MQLENFALRGQFTIRNIFPQYGAKIKKKTTYTLYTIQYTVDINAYTVILITSDRQNQFKI